MINKKYNEFLPSMQSAEDLVSQVDSLSGNIDLLKSRIENEVRQDLNVAIAEFTELKQQLERDSLVLSVLKQLQEVRKEAGKMASDRKVFLYFVPLTSSWVSIVNK
ncbi:centromere/kinetochore protein zw10 homolog [Emys orbicularis]|uniref:centromere/kinetochore protein zw10 homolog n=1 Tax=Emys orbicularis TaxID=82168 RepID=UPI0031FDD6B2